MKMIKKLLMFTLSCAILVACGDKKEKKSKSFSYEKKKEVVKEVKSDTNDIVITGNDMMQFNKKELDSLLSAEI